MLADKRKVGVIFDAGAIYGFFGLSFAKALWRRGVKPVALGGVSVGALNAAKLAENNSSEGIRALEEIWLEIDRIGPTAVFDSKLKVIGRLSLHPHSSSLYPADKLMALAHKIDPIKLMQSDTLLQVVVTDKINDCRKIVSNRDAEFQKNPGLILDYIQASASIPGAFPPVLSEANAFMDGFVFAPLLESFADFGCDTIFVVMNDPKRKPVYAEVDFDVEIFRAFRSLQTEINRIKIEEFLEKHTDYHPFDYEAEDDDPPVFKTLKKLSRWVATTIVDGNIDGIRHQLVVVFPHCYVPFYPSKFRKGQIAEAIQRGMEESDRILDKLENQ